MLECACCLHLYADPLLVVPASGSVDLSVVAPASGAVMETDDDGMEASAEELRPASVAAPTPVVAQSGSAKAASAKKKKKKGKKKAAKVQH